MWFLIRWIAYSAYNMFMISLLMGITENRIFSDNAVFVISFCMGLLLAIGGSHEPYK
jgi:hypothetical protein